ncbi:atos homolog protein A [Ctenodactylus gundi]
MKPERDALDEYFEYDAEDFLVSLALLITEGRTPECSARGRTESSHCPPAQSCCPVTPRHECSDKLAQCRQARRTRAEVALLWKSSLPVMVEVMLLPDCCYGDDGPTAEGADLEDPAVKQDALLLERWVLEPVPRQHGERFVEEKTLLLAVRSFVFFSQLSAWLSVSHGAIPRNILYRISAADGDLQWDFSQTPIEHVFPVPSVSHKVALKVSVQSLPRQSNYPVLACSIHTNIGLYEKRIQELDLKTYPHRPPPEAERGSADSPLRLCSKQAWPGAPQRALLGKTGTALEYSTAIKNVRLYPAAGGKSQARIQGFSDVEDPKSPGAPGRASQSFSAAESGISGHRSSWQPAGEMHPLIDSLIQDRQDVIARIAQHLTHCDLSVPRVPGHPFPTQESSSLSSKLYRVSQESDWLRKVKEAVSPPAAHPESLLSADSSEGKRGVKAVREMCPPRGPPSQPPGGDAGPLIGSLLQERREVIARIAQHLEHMDPAAPRGPRLPLSAQDSGLAPSKVFTSSYKDSSLLKKSQADVSVSVCFSQGASSGDRGDAGSSQPDRPLGSFQCNSKEGSSPNPPVKDQCLDSPHAEARSVRQGAQDRAAGPRSLSPGSQCGGAPEGQQAGSRAGRQRAPGSCVDRLAGTAAWKVRVGKSENDGPVSGRLRPGHSEETDPGVNVSVLQASECASRHAHHRHSQDSKRPKTSEQKLRLSSIENRLGEDQDSIRYPTADPARGAESREEGPAATLPRGCPQRQSARDGVSACGRRRNAEALQVVSICTVASDCLLGTGEKPLSRTSPKRPGVWRKHPLHSADGAPTRAFHPRTGLPLLSSPVPQRKSQSGCFDLDSSFLHVKSLASGSSRPCVNGEDGRGVPENPLLSSSAPPIPSLSLLGNFEESVLNYRLDPLGIVEGFTAEVGASGLFCPTHLTLPVEVSFYSVSDDNAPSPYMGVITLESLGRRGYRVPPAGTIQVTLFNPNKTVVKMFVVIYDLRDMPANHQTFLRQRTFSVPVKPEMKRSASDKSARRAEERLLRYLIHLRFQSSRSGKLYLHRDVRLLFSRKSMEVDSGAAYELRSYTESPTNPQFSPRC